MNNRILILIPLGLGLLIAIVILSLPQTPPSQKNAITVSLNSQVPLSQR